MPSELNKRRAVEVIARALRISITHGQRIQKELARFEATYPSHTRAHELLRAALAANLDETRRLEAELAALETP